MVYQSFESAAILYGDSCALVFGEERLTYQQLLGRVGKLANAIQFYAGDDRFIGISATRSLEMVVGVLAILKANKTYVPLDPKYPRARLEQLVQDSGITFCLCNQVENVFFQEMGLQAIQSDSDYNFENTIENKLNPVVCVLYTSGSTGAPKGVCLPQQGLLNQINWQKKNGFAKPFVKTLQYCHLSFDAAFQEIFVPLSTGGTLYIVDDLYRLNAGNLLKYINEHQINRLFLPYAMLQLLSETAVYSGLYPNTIQEIITGGELLRITPQIANFFSVLQDTTLMNVYGPTEASVWVTELKLKGNALEWPAIPSIGKPIAGIELFIVDKDLKELPIGETGEILICGDCLAIEYLNKPNQTAEKFISWEHSSKGKLRVYRTGDMAFLKEDGMFQFMCRIDGQVKIRGGNRVELGEIEIELSKINGVRQAEVIVREDLGIEKKIVAYVIAKNNQITSADLKKQLHSKLPDYMIPSAIVLMDTFPYTVSGKVDRTALPVPRNQGLSDEEVIPTTETERYIEALWKELIGLDKVGAREDFFDMGGDSLLAIQMMVRIEKEKGVQLPLFTLYNNPTIEQMAKSLDEASAENDYQVLVAIKASGNRIPLYLIHGDNLSILSFAGIGKFINPDQPVYALQPKGMDGKSEPLASIESLAAFYNQAIFEQNPSGPYAVIGYSFGGYVAFEMAKQMRAKGKSVLLLGLFDTNTSNAENHLNNKAKFFRFLGRIIPKIKWLFQSFLHHPIRSTNYQITALKNRLRSYFKLGTKAVVEELEGYQKLMDQVNAVHHKALSHYHLVPVDEKIVLFKAMERIYFVDDFEFLGWRTYAKKGVEVRQIPGDHDTMLKEENAPVLAAALDDAMLKAISEWKSESVNV